MRTPRPVRVACSGVCSAESMIGIENYVSEQLLLFLRSIGLGLCLGLLYDLLGALRGLGGKVWGGVMDALFCLTAAVSVLFFILAGDGELRVFIALGVVGGAVLFWCLLGRILRPVWVFWLELILLPAHIILTFIKKCGHIGKKVFSFCKNWYTMKVISLRGRRKPPPREGEEDMGRPTGKKPAPRKKRRASTRPSSKLTMLVLAALLIGLGVQIYSMFGQLQEAQALEEVYAQQLDELRDTNEQLKEDLDNSGNQALMEDIARDQLGMVAPGEKVFHFSK